MHEMPSTTNLDLLRCLLVEDTFRGKNFRKSEYNFFFMKVEIPWNPYHFQSLGTLDSAKPKFPNSKTCEFCKDSSISLAEVNEF